MRIFVTGYGLISSIGFNCNETVNSLLQQKTGIKKHALTNGKEFLLGKIEQSSENLRKQFNISEITSRTALLGMIAVQDAIKNLNWDDEIKTGLISGTSVGGMDFSEIQYQNRLNEIPEDKSAYAHHASGTTTDEIASQLPKVEFVNTISTACSSALNAILMGARMIRTGKLDRVIVGGTDALSDFTVNGFNSLMIFDKEQCRPFDESRAGLNLGEGAGYIVIESEGCVKKLNSQTEFELKGWASTSDAHHQTASSPEGIGAILSMKKALEIAKMNPNEIDYINAHGTSTPNNDLSESHAIKTVFGKKIPAFSSTKSFTGHTLAASGGIETIFGLLAMKENFGLTNLNFENKIGETGLIPVQSTEGQNWKNVLVNAFGFGGNCSSIILSKI